MQINVIREQLNNHFTGDGDWLRDLRQRALIGFEKVGLPTVSDEAWKYTNIRAIAKRDFNYAMAASALSLADIKHFFITDCYPIVFVNGKFNASLSELPANILIQNLADTLRNQTEAIKPYLGQLSQHIHHGFAALNTAFINDGVFIKIPANTEVLKPIQLLFISHSNDIVTYPRNLIIAEENSKAFIIENYVALNNSNYLTNVISEITLKTGAKLEHLKIQQEDEKSFHIGTTQVELQQDSEFISHVMNFGGQLSRVDTNVDLNGKGASCHLNGLYLMAGKQHCDHHTLINHLVPHCSSREFYKGILDGYSRAVFNGQVYVHPGATKSDADQSNKNLLLSDHAEIDTKPQLEIYNDDVKCTHGATVGQLNEKELFYLRSRGLDLETVQSILTYAFASEVVERIKNKTIYNHLQQLILQRLPAGEKIKELLS